MVDDKHYLTIDGEPSAGQADWQQWGYQLTAVAYNQLVKDPQDYLQAPAESSVGAEAIKPQLTEPQQTVEQAETDS